MLTYEAGPGSNQLLEPEVWDRDSEGKSQLYDPPIAEFSVLRVELEREEKSEHEGVEGPSLVVVTQGKGRVSRKDGNIEEVGKGDVLFIGANEEVVWSASERLVLFRAYVEAPKE
jgi:mannose-6-phosphate isomerase